MWQHECHLLGKKFDILFEIQVYWCDVSLDTRCCWEETVTSWEDSHNREWIKYDDNVVAQRKTKKLYVASRLDGAPHMI